jgi:hypothetical protein
MTTKHLLSGGAIVFSSSSVKRFFAIAVVTAALHAFLALALASLSTNHIEQERFDGKMSGHTAFRAMGIAAQALFYPLLWLPRGEISEPRTTLLFIANSLLWGIVIATVDTLVRRRHRRRGRMISE